MTSSRPGLLFDEQGMCSACRWHERKKTIDWEDRARQFQAIADWAKAKTKAPWDCVVGVSGGKDSLWQAYQLRDQFGLHPLLVQFVSADGTELGRYNAENMVKSGFTLVSVQPNPEVARQLAKKSFYKFGNIAKYSEYSLFTAPFRVAVDYDIPLVLLGENPALEVGDKNRDNPGWDASGIRFNNTLSGGSIEVWKGDGIEQRDLIPYIFPSLEELRWWGGRGVFMGYFLNWSGWENAIFAITHGMGTIAAPYDDIGIHFRHNSLDSDNGAMVNSMLKHIKMGFGHTSEFASYDIRSGRITRREAAALARRLDGRCHTRYVEAFCEWVDIRMEQFWEVANSYRGSMWAKEASGRWVIENPVWSQYDDLNDVDTDEVIRRVDTVRIAKERYKES